MRSRLSDVITIAGDGRGMWEERRGKERRKGRGVCVGREGEGERSVGGSEQYNLGTVTFM